MVMIDRQEVDTGDDSAKQGGLQCDTGRIPAPTIEPAGKPSEE